VVLAAPKSVSVCYTALLVEWCGGAAHMLLEGHYAAISTALRYLNQEAAWAVIEPDRGGAPALGESTGLRVIQLAHIAANDDPARPPHVHTHLYVDPQVTAMEDGLEHRLDLTMFRRGLVAAVAVYDGALHGELTRSLGVRFEDTAGVRRCELVGVFPELICEFAGTACRPDRSVPQLLGMDFIPPTRVPA
jgi:hypothetical protein